jgi:alkanesulfonate monooxygenase SsuD/methylene tetrahydromethanopterin reductase-like flavin-dependent oxidoreductase (luciferase family)
LQPFLLLRGTHGTRKLEHWVSWFHEQTDGDEVSVIAQTAESLGFAGVAFSDHIAIPKNHTALHPELRQPYDYRLPMVTALRSPQAWAL